MCCAIWYQLYNLKNVKNTHGGVSLLVKLQAKSKWYQIAQNITNKHWEEITHRDNLTHNTNWLVFGKGEQAHIYG